MWLSLTTASLGQGAEGTFTPAVCMSVHISNRDTTLVAAADRTALAYRSGAKGLFTELARTLILGNRASAKFNSRKLREQKEDRGMLVPALL
jgi:hypothetical protein